MAIYHKHNNTKVKVGDSVTLINNVEAEVEGIFEYTFNGAGVYINGIRFLCSEVNCFHSTGNDEIFNKGLNNAQS